MQIFCVGQEERMWFEAFLPEELRQEEGPASLLYGAVDEQSGTAVGALLAQADGNTLELTWICVADAWRRRGVAMQMVGALTQDASQAAALRTVRATLTGRDEAAAALLRRCGFSVQPSGQIEYSFTLADVQKGAFWAQRLDISAAAPLDSVPEQVLAEFNRRAARENLLPVSLPVRREEYDCALSMCYMAGGKLAGLLLANRINGALYLSCLYADAEHPRAAAVLLQAAAGQAVKTNSPETQVLLASVSEAAQGLASKLLPAAAQRAGSMAEYQLDRKWRR